MKILVPTKRVPDTDQRIPVSDDGRSIDASSLPYVINPFDAIALEEALRIREAQAGETEILAVGIGGDVYEDELRSALAMGADRAMIIESGTDLDPWNVARTLAALVERERPDLVLMGKQAVDDDLGQTGQFLAALLDWPQATFASKVEFIGQRELRVARETDSGIETVRVRLPAVVTADLRLNEPRYASLPSILKARKKPIERVAFSELGVDIQPRIEVVALEAASSKRQCVRVSSIDELLTKLRDDAGVL